MKTYSNNKGFTLLELLVALVLVGIILSFATLTFDSGEDRRIKEEANRFYSLVKLAQEESILNGKELTLEIDANGYRFKTLTTEGEEAIGDPVFRERVFAEYIHPVINIEKSQFNLKSQKDKEQPQSVKIFILSSGELTPFQIEFPASDKNYEIVGSIQGTVEIIMHHKDS